MGKIISIAIPKGGVGKTTTAVNVAASLAVLEKKILLIDIDPAGACSVSLNFSKHNINGGVFDLLAFTKSLNAVIHKTEIPNLDFIPVNVVSYEAEEKMNRLTTNVLLLKNILSQEYLPYDFIIIDCPPYLRGITNLGLAASDSVIIPVRSANFSINALKKMIEHMSWVQKNFNKNLTIEGILHTMYESRTIASFLTDKSLYELIGVYVFITRIPKSTAISESTFYGKPAVLYDVHAIGSAAYLNLAKELLVRNKVCPLITIEKNRNLVRIPTSETLLFKLVQNYPNPFHYLTTIEFTIPKEAFTKLEIYGLDNKKISTLFGENLKAGRYEYKWQPNGLKRGVYTCRLTHSTLSETKKIVYSD